MKNVFESRKIGRKNSSILKMIWKEKLLYLMLLPVLANFVIFHYLPMYGLKIAFQRYDLFLGTANSAWVGFDNFNKFFTSSFSMQIISNTLILSILEIIIGFPLPIFIAILLSKHRPIVFLRTDE